MKSSLHDLWSACPLHSSQMNVVRKQLAILCNAQKAYIESNAKQMDEILQTFHSESKVLSD